MILQIILTVMSFLLLAAHFMRGGHVVLVAACCLAPFFLFVKRDWARRIVQTLLYAGTVVWLITTMILAQQRLAQGGSWVRLLLILGGVNLLTLIAGLLLGTTAVKKRFATKPANA